MRIVVVGVGGLGGLYGGMLARRGEDVTFVARGPSLEALRARGLTVRSPSLGNFTVSARATDNPEELDLPDLVLFCVKTYDLERAAEQIRPLVGPSTTVLPPLNGIEATSRLRAIVGKEAVLVGISYARSTRTAPATIDHMANTKIVLGEPAGGISARVEAIAGVLRRAGIDAEAHAAPELPLWEKLVAHGAFGGMTALTRLPLGPMLACFETRAMLHDVILEIVAVARSRGVAIPTESVDRIATMAGWLASWGAPVAPGGSGRWPAPRTRKYHRRNRATRKAGWCANPDECRDLRGAQAVRGRSIWPALTVCCLFQQPAKSSRPVNSGRVPCVAGRVSRLGCA
jgi:2-dehydropantoate 2-reductase